MPTLQQREMCKIIADDVLNGVSLLEIANKYNKTTRQVAESVRYGMWIIANEGNPRAKQWFKLARIPGNGAMRATRLLQGNVSYFC